MRFPAQALKLNGFLRQATAVYDGAAHSTPTEACLFFARRTPLRGGFTVAVILSLSASAIIGSRAGGQEHSGLEFYERKIRPLLVDRCYECHSKSAKRPDGGLLLDTSSGVRAGGENGAIIDVETPDASLLLEAVRYEGDIQMPPTGKLPAAEIALLQEWVKRGAPLPDDNSIVAATKGIDFTTGRKFWSFQPPRASPPPISVDGLPTPIDAFLQAKRATDGLSPAPPADRTTLIRRAHFDLVGLPPSPDEVEAFVKDKAPDSYERLIDRLLASPHYGERWGRHWLDLARYADGNTTSLETRDQAWMYRDWVVQALNNDLPYDQFVRRQLAADKLPDLPPNELAALGFLAISPDYWKELQLSPTVIRTIVADEWEERIDAVGRTFLGLSLACARCHDHKFDPVSAEDYYALAGVLASTRFVERSVLPPAEAAIVQAARAEVAKLTEEIKQLKSIKQPTPEQQARLISAAEQARKIERATPHYQSATAHAVDDAALFVEANGSAHTKLTYKPGEARDLAVQIRGNPGKLGPIVPRRFLTVFAADKPEPFTEGSGRRELADAIVGPAAPLSARVIVNRTWALHFGRGLVETVSDFGTQGERPTHPELLDDLTRRFIDDGWSLKHLHRTIMTSAAYQQASAWENKSALAVNPDNRLLWRMNRRRLDIEAWRDALLAVCGNLDLRRGGPSNELTVATNLRRTLYGRIDRSDPDVVLRLFDFPEPSAHAPTRTPTTTALQQLFVLNGPLMTRQSGELAELLVVQQPATPADIVHRAYRRLFAREPSETELGLGTKYLTADSATPTRAVVRQYAQVLLGSNEFLFVD